MDPMFMEAIPHFKFTAFSLTSNYCRVSALCIDLKKNRENAAFSCKFSDLTFFYTLRKNNTIKTIANCVLWRQCAWKCISTREFESVETSLGFARQVSALCTYLRFFFVKKQHSVLNFHHLTNFFHRNHESICDFAKGD